MPSIVMGIGLGLRFDAPEGVLLPPALSAPIISGLPSFGGTVEVGQTINLIAAFSYGNPAPTRTWQVLRDGVPISGADAAAYLVVSLDAGTTLAPRQIETNGIGSPAVATGAGVAVPVPAPADTAPSISGVPVATGTAQVGQTLTATPGTASGNPTPTRSWEWLREGTPIAGATASTYLLVSADEGALIRPRQTEWNGVGSPAVATGAAVGPVAAAPIPTGNALTMDGDALAMDGEILSMEA